MKFCYNMSFTLSKHPKDLDLSYMMDLDICHCFRREKFCLITEELWYIQLKE